MTIQIPDGLAREPEGMAAAQKKSVEEVALQNLRSLFNETQPPTLLKTLRRLPHPSAEAVDDLEAAIFAGRLGIRDQSLFK